MRVMVAAAACCLVLVGLSSAQDAHAAVRKPVEIPAQSLASALAALAKQRDMQIIYRSDVVGSLKSEGAVGEFTPTEALRKLLTGSGLTYHYLNDTTVTITPVSATSAGAASPPVSSGSVAQSSSSDGGGQSAGFWNQVLLAQANQGQASGSSSVGGSAQGSSPSSEAQPSLQQVLVTAQKRTEREQDVPVPVYVINPESLADTSQLLLKDYYSTVPGLNVTPELGSNVSIAIRGITPGGVANPTVSVMIDDVPYSSSTSLTGGNQVPDFDPGDLARIEVLRGPQGTLYGSNSLGGLIKYVTADPSTDGYSGRIEAGTDGVYGGAEPGFSLRASANIPVSDTFAMRASVYTRQDAGYISNPVYDFKGVNEAQAYGGRWSGLWKPVENLSIKLSAQYQRIEALGDSEVVVGPGLGDLEQNDIPRTAPYSRLAQAYSAVVDYKVGSVDLTSVTGYNATHFVDSVDFTSAYGGITQTDFQVGGAPVFEHGDLSKLTQELRLTTPLGPNFDWLLGMFFTHEVSSDIQAIWAENTTNGQLVAQTYYGSFPGAYLEYAGFTDLTYHVTERFDVQVGGRESHIDVIQQPQYQSGPFAGGTSLSPRAESKADAFTYLVTPRFKISSDWMAYARLASGYRPGGLNLGPGLPPAYSPDKTKNYEVGLKGDFLDDALSVDASVYYINWENIQIGLRDPENSFLYQANGGDAKSEGVELALTARPYTGLTLSTWITYDDAVLTQDFPADSTAYGVSGNRLPNSSRLSGNFTGEKDFPLPWWSDGTGFFSGQISYVGDRLGVFVSKPSGVFIVPPERQSYGGYAKIDLRTGVRYDSWTVQAYVNNAGDRRGLLDGGLGYYNPAAFIIIQPRTIGVSVSKSF